MKLNELLTKAGNALRSTEHCIINGVEASEAAVSKVVTALEHVVAEAESAGHAVVADVKVIIADLKSEGKKNG